MFSKPKQKSSEKKREERKKQDEGKAEMTKLDTFFTQTQAKASMPLEASLPASSVNEAALTAASRFSGLSGLAILSIENSREDFGPEQHRK